MTAPHIFEIYGKHKKRNWNYHEIKEIIGESRVAEGVSEIGSAPLSSSVSINEIAKQRVLLKKAFCLEKWFLKNCKLKARNPRTCRRRFAIPDGVALLEVQLGV